MQPPICEYCGLDFRADDLQHGGNGGLVHFADYEALPEGMVGHPKGLAWFCATHIGAARSLKNLTLEKALAQWHGSHEA